MRNVENFLIFRTRDVDGKARKTGGDPVEVELQLVALDPHLTQNRLADAHRKRAEDEVKNIRVVDENDGTYHLFFRLVLGFWKF